MRTQRKHMTPLRAAKCIRRWCESNRPIFKIAKTWDDYFGDAHERLNAYNAGILIQEQCNGAMNTAHHIYKPYSYPQIQSAMERVFPELFADYWESLPSQ